jgi:hypothetical protein
MRAHKEYTNRKDAVVLGIAPLITKDLINSSMMDWREIKILKI